MDISGLDKVEVFAALYNVATVLGMGAMHHKPGDIPIEEARAIVDESAELDHRALYFDYVNGRVMKVDLSGDDLRTALFNRDNGENAAENAIAMLAGA